MSKHRTALLRAWVAGGGRAGVGCRTSIFSLPYLERSMAAISPGKGRAEVMCSGSKVVVTIPSKRNISIIGFLGFWLVGWAFGEVTAIYQLIAGPNGGNAIFLTAWLGAWTIGGSFAIYAWLWNLIGREIITLDSKILKYERKISFYSRISEYEVAHIGNLRAAPYEHGGWFNRPRGMEVWGLSGGSIAFDYGRSTHHFGIALDAADASYVIEQLSKCNASISR